MGYLNNNVYRSIDINKIKKVGNKIKDNGP
jgi:hypothetical protein